MENVADFSELPLFNNRKIVNQRNNGVCPEKVESIVKRSSIRSSIGSNIICDGT